VRLVANPQDEVAFKRMVKLLPGIGNRTAENLWRAWTAAAVAGIGDPGREKTSTAAVAAGVERGPGETSASAGGGDASYSPAPGYRFGERLLAMSVPAKSKKAWTQLAHTLDEIAPAGQPNMPSEMITSVVEAIYDDYAKVNFTNYELRREDLNQLVIFARQFKDVHEFLSQLALISNVDAEAAPMQVNEKEAVNLSSVHQAKGLEFHAVFVIWLTDGMFPSNRSLDTRDALEEERRLFYVAITRARDELYLTYPQMRLSGGYGDVFQRPSRFLQEIPDDLVEDWQVTRK
ncbi:MAG: ATP-binding domain-containing protein, partial [Verrucomicrobia bacterium]|nr:ATP-binding domain-containing protein [Verrucomicrobiota bacterium]